MRRSAHSAGSPTIEVFEHVVHGDGVIRHRGVYLVVLEDAAGLPVFELVPFPGLAQDLARLFSGPLRSFGDIDVPSDPPFAPVCVPAGTGCRFLELGPLGVQH